MSTILEPSKPSREMAFFVVAVAVGLFWLVYTYQTLSRKKSKPGMSGRDAGQERLVELVVDLTMYFSRFNERGSFCNSGPQATTRL